MRQFPANPSVASFDVAIFFTPRGVALGGATHGERNTSEAEQARAILQRIPRGSIVLADANFGIFGVVHPVGQSSCPVLFRMTKPRFRSVAPNRGFLKPSSFALEYHLDWRSLIRCRAGPQLTKPIQTPGPDGTVLLQADTVMPLSRHRYPVVAAADKDGRA